MFTENLRTALNNEGDSLTYIDLTPPNAISTSISATQRDSIASAYSAEIPAQSYRDSTHLAAYGRVYNHYALLSEAKVCPKGTHVLSVRESYLLEKSADAILINDPSVLTTGVWYPGVDDRVTLNSGYWWLLPGVGDDNADQPDYVPGQNQSGFGSGGSGVYSLTSVAFWNDPPSIWASPTFYENNTPGTQYSAADVLRNLEYASGYFGGLRADSYSNALNGGNYTPDRHLYAIRCVIDDATEGLSLIHISEPTRPY